MVLKFNDNLCCFTCLQHIIFNIIFKVWRVFKVTGESSKLQPNVCGLSSECKSMEQLLFCLNWPRIFLERIVGKINYCVVRDDLVTGNKFSLSHPHAPLSGVGGLSCASFPFLFFLLFFVFLFFFCFLLKDWKQAVNCSS